MAPKDLAKMAFGLALELQTPAVDAAFDRTRERLAELPRYSLEVEGIEGAATVDDLEAFLADNADGFSEEEVAEIRALQSGQETNMGGGAAPLFTLRRER